MKKITYFYLENCPHCKKANKILDTLLSQPQYAGIEIEYIEERKQADIANSYDYYYVPCFYIGKEKLHEGAVSEEDIKKVLNKALG